MREHGSAVRETAGRRTTRLVRRAAAAGLVASGLIGVALATPAAAAFKVTATVNVGGTPDGVAVDTSTGTIYEANNFGSVMEINGTTVTNTISIPGQLEGVAVDSGTHTAYVVDASEAALHEIVGTTVTATVSIPNAEGVPAVNPTTHIAYVNDVSDNQVYEVSGSSVAGIINVGSGPNGEIGLDTSNGEVYTANSSSNDVSVISGGSVIATVPVGTEPSGVAVDPTTHIAYVANFGSNTVSEIYNNSVIATVSVGSQPLYPVVDPTTHRVYVTSFGSKKVDMLLGDQVLGTAPVQKNPSAIALNTASHLAYVTNQGANTMSVLSIPPPLAAAWGYAQVNSGVVSATYQGNSLGRTNTVSVVGTGQYQVVFPGLGGKGSAGGTVDVSATYTGGGAAYCNSGGWFQFTGNVYATVNCYDRSGNPANGSFDIEYADAPVKGAPPALTYVWANQPSTASYTPSLYYQYNSTGTPDSITRSSAGNYAVNTGGLTVNDGTVTVTAYGSNAECRVNGWFGTTVDVYCATPAGAATDSDFTMTFVAGASLLGVKGHSFAYLWANQPTATSPYNPASTYADNSSGGTITITPVSTGNWTVTMNGLGASNLGDVQVNAYTSGAADCAWTSLSGSGTTETAGVECENTAGVPVDSYFTLQFVH
jgi:YVTN family beta-propeller protein